MMESEEEGKGSWRNKERVFVVPFCMFAMLVLRRRLVTGRGVVSDGGCA